MTRRTADNAEAEGDFASGMGLAIGAFIALFAGAILVFMLGQDNAQRSPAQRGKTALSAPVAPADATSTGGR